MSNDPLAVPDIWGDPPNEADYEAVHATVMATARGRWFLSEYARRNRHADTNLLIGALARIEAAIRGDSSPQSSAIQFRGLVEVAAAIDRVTAAFTTGVTPAPDVTSAAERIQDLAFALREHTLEAAMCDALDVAAREICEACAKHDAAGEGARQAAAQLRDLAGRVDGMMMQFLAGRNEPSGAEPAGAEDATKTATEQPVKDLADDEAGRAGDTIDRDDLSRDNLFTADMLNNEDFGRVVEALAAALPALASDAEAASGPQSEPAPEPPAPAMVSAPTEPSPVELSPAEALQPEPSLSELPPEPSPSEPLPEPLPLESMPTGPVNDNLLPAATLTGEAMYLTTDAPTGYRPPWYIEAPDFAARATAPQVRQDLSGQPSRLLLPTPLPLPGPQEDPADLFEPQPSLVDTPNPADTPVPPAEAAAAAASKPEHDQSASIDIALNGIPAMRPLPRPATGDPLAPIRALSEEETIALFS